MTTSIRVQGDVTPSSLCRIGKCIYCGQPEQAELQMKIRTPEKKLRLRVPYCNQHSRQAKRNRILIRATWGVSIITAAASYVLLGYLLWPYLSTSTEDDIGRYIADLVILVGGLVALTATVWLIRRVLSRYFTSLNDTPNATLGFDAMLSNNTLVFTFVNDRIAAEFRSSLPDSVYPSSPHLGQPISTVPEQPRATPWREGQFRTVVILILGSLLCVVVLFLLVYFCIIPGTHC